MQKKGMEKQGPKPMGKEKHEDGKHEYGLSMMDEYNTNHTSTHLNSNNFRKGL